MNRMNISKPCNELRRLKAAFGYSYQGLRQALRHPAFRIELFACALAAPASFIFGHSGVERALLLGSLFLVLIVELLNTGIETAINRISTEIHPLSKLAKDVGSAAVLLSILNAFVVWFMVVCT